jgi:hypothetical protein
MYTSIEKERKGRKEDRAKGAKGSPKRISIEEETEKGEGQENIVRDPRISRVRLSSAIPQISPQVLTTISPQIFGRFARNLFSSSLNTLFRSMAPRLSLGDSPGPKLTPLVWL